MIAGSNGTLSRLFQILYDGSRCLRVHQNTMEYTGNTNMVSVNLKNDNTLFKVWKLGAIQRHITNIYKYWPGPISILLLLLGSASFSPSNWCCEFWRMAAGSSAWMADTRRKRWRKWGDPYPGWFIRESPIKIRMFWGYPYFRTLPAID